MKTIKYIILSFIAVTMVACEKEEAAVNTIFDVDGGQSLVDFSRSSSNLPVLINEVGSVNVTVNVTTRSSSDRTVSISVDPSSTADAENYTVPTSVTIPANEYQGVFTIDATDVSVEPDAETIILNIDGFSGANVTLAGNQHVVSLFQVCPVPDTFLVGDYMLSDVTATVGPGNGTVNFPTGVVTISIPVDADGDVIDPVLRQFTTPLLPAFTPNPLRVQFGLVCGRIVFQERTTTLSCDGGATFYNFATAGSNNSFFDESFVDDTSFIINYTEDVDGSCGGPFLSSFMLTKI